MAEEPKTSEAKGNRRCWPFLRFWPVPLTALLTVVCLEVPRAPVTANFEASWAAVLAYAHQHKLRFGQDIVFSYGPLGFLTTSFFSPTGAATRLVVDTLFALAVASGVCLVAKGLELFSRCLLLALFVFLTTNLVYNRFDLLTYFGLFSWAVLCVSERGALLRTYLAGFALMALFAALTKFVFLYFAVLCSAVISAELALRGKPRVGALLLLGALAAFILCWAALGQNPAHIVSFLSRGLVMANGYQHAMSAEGPLSGSVLGCLVLSLAFATAAVRVVAGFSGSDIRSPWRRALLFLWLGGVLFLTWKHGFVRADRYHAPIFLAFAPLLAMSVGALPCTNFRLGRLARSLGIVSVIISFTVLQSFFFPGSIKASLRKPGELCMANFRTLLYPTAYLREMREVAAVERTRAQLPRLRQFAGQEPVDFFGSDQAYAIFNDFNYRPRPVFQSYAACTPELMHLNAQFFHSEKAPAYVLLRLDQIDHRFPPLEDATAFRDLLINYRFLESEDGTFLLKAESHSAPRLTLLREGTLPVGEKISLENQNEDDLWLEILIQPTLRGRITDFLYHTTGTRLAVWTGPAESRPIHFRAPAAMLRAGFLVRPFISSNDDLARLFTHQPLVRPEAVSLTVQPENKDLWESVFRFRLYSINPASRVGR